MTPEESVEKSLADARDRGSRATQVLAVVFIALIASWLADFRPRLQTFRDYFLSQPQLERKSNLEKSSTRLRAVITSMEQRIKATEEQLAKTTKPQNKKDLQEELEIERTRLQETKHQYENSTKNLQAAVSQFNSRRKVAEQVKFKLFGLEFGVSGFWAPLMWLAVFLAAVSHLALSRRALLREYKTGFESLGTQEATIVPAQHIRIPRLPAWAVPIPTLSTRGTAHEINQLVKPSFTDDWLSYFSIALGVVCLYFGLQVARIALAVPWFTSAPDRVGYAFFIVTVLCATVLVISTWFSRTWFFGTNAQAISASRRRFLALSVTTGIITLVYPAGRSIARRSLINPRYRRRMGEEEYLKQIAPKSKLRMKPRYKFSIQLQKRKPGFYEQLSKSTIHHVPKEGKAHSLLGVRQQDLRELPKAELSAKQYERLHISAVLPWLRQFTDNQVKAKAYSAAHTQLLRAIEDLSDPSSHFRGVGNPTLSLARKNYLEEPKALHVHLQIYDLLAKVAEASQCQAYLQDAISAAQKKHEEFEALAAAYQNEHPTPLFVTHSLAVTEAEDLRAKKAPRRFNIHRYKSVLERFEQRAPKSETEKKLTTIWQGSRRDDISTRLKKAFEQRVTFWSRLSKEMATKRYKEQVASCGKHGSKYGCAERIRDRKLHRRVRHASREHVAWWHIWTLWKKA